MWFVRKEHVASLITSREIVFSIMTYVVVMLSGDCIVWPESMECLIEDQAFLESYDSAPRPPPSPLPTM
jgi:hypothetical protein